MTAVNTNQRKETSNSSLLGGVPGGEATVPVLTYVYLLSYWRPSSVSEYTDRKRED